MAPSWRSLALTLTVLGVIGLCQGSSTPDYKCFGYNVGRGTIFPEGDINVEVGSTYEAYCLFNPEEFQLEDVYFESIGKDRRNISHTVVNSSAIKVEVEHQEPTSYDLRCSVRNDHFLCERTVYVGYPPKDVENFTCLSKNYETLNCTWDVPKNPVKVNYSLMYNITGYIPKPCPNSGKNWCHWRGVHFYGWEQHWNMTIVAENKLTEKPVEFIHYVDMFASVLPNPATRFSGEVLGPREVNLTWRLPHPMNVFTAGKVIHEVRYRIMPFRNMYQNSPWVLVNKWKESPPRWQTKTHYIVIGDLQPYVWYEFSVRLHTGTGPEREDMWSKPALLVKRTEATKPTIAPLTTPGMFEVEETKLNRDVYVSWQTVDPLQENGPEFGYDVRVYDSRHGSPLFPAWTTENCFLKFPRLENNISYRFEIRPKNSEGLPEASDVKAEVLVPPKAALLRTPRFFKVIAYTGTNTTTYMVRWRLPEQQQPDINIDSVTLFWCKQSEYENRCHNKIEWQIIDEPDMHAKNLTGFDASSRYMFGISINSLNSSSGIKWSGCIASYGVQLPPMKTFTITNVSSTEVRLKWALDCQAEAAQPNAFNISYCIVQDNGKDCSEPEKFVTAEGESTVEYVVRNLLPYRNYIFSIATISDLGLGKWTPSHHVRTKASKPSGPPQNLRVTGKSHSWIVLAWDPPVKSEQNGEIINYVLKNKIAGSTTSSHIEDDALSYNFTSLEPFTDYHFEVIPCTRAGEGKACGTMAADINVKTMIGVPGKIDSFLYDPPLLKWDHEECNGPNCFYELQYTVNGTTFHHTTPLGHTSVSLTDLNISCPVLDEEFPISLLPLSTDEEGRQLEGPSSEMKVPCPSKGLPLWLILTIAVVCIFLTLIVVFLFTYGREQFKIFMLNLYRKLALPNGLDPQLQPPSVKNPWYMPVRDNIPPTPPSFKSSDQQDLIKHGSERQHRNFSGDSGTSVADPADSSGCSTGGDSVSSSGSDRIHQSSDSGTVQEEAGFPSEEKMRGGSVRLRTPAPPYVVQGLPDKAPNMKGYVSLGSVPNLTGPAVEGMSPLQQSNPTLGMEPLQEVRMGGRRTSTGYVSMPTNESDGMSFPLDDLGNLVLPHERRPGDYLPYSRHYYMPYKKTSDFSPYTKAQSLPWLNTGYVAVAQAEDGGQTLPGAQGYVAVGDAMNMMKRQPSLPSLPMDVSKMLITPDEDLPPGAYCKLGARGSPDPPPSSHGYVSETHHMAAPSSLPLSPPVNKASYVTCAMAESLASPEQKPRKATPDYISVGDMNDGQWAHPIMHPDTPEETREVLSAPVEGTRSRVVQPVRPNSSETNHNRKSSQFAPTGHSLSKQSSGYASGNVSQETLNFHDTLVMSPKKLLARSNEPHSVVYSPNHKPSMV